MSQSEPTPENNRDNINSGRQEQNYQRPSPGFNAPFTRQYSRITAAILSILLGGLGAHKFYLGKTLQGIIYIVLAPTGISSLIGVLEGIRFLCLNDEHFDEIVYR